MILATSSLISPLELVSCNTLPELPSQTLKLRSVIGFPVFPLSKRTIMVDSWAEHTDADRITNAVQIQNGFIAVSRY